MIKYSRENIIGESAPGHIIYQNGINECMYTYVLVLVCLVLEAMLLHIINFAFYRKRGLFENQNVSVLPEKGVVFGGRISGKGFFSYRKRGYVLCVCMGVDDRV